MAKAIDLLYNNLSKATDFAIELFRKELRDQGHRSSGRLEESFAKVISIKINDVAKGIINIEEQYGFYLDKGVKNPRYNPQVLIPWLKRIKPGYSIKEYTSIAWAIKKTHEREGMPARGSYSYTDNGRRKGWIENGVKGKEEDIANVLDLALFLQMLVKEESKEFLLGSVNNAA